MKYIVIVRYLFHGKPWKTIQLEFAERGTAEAYAREMYAGDTEKSVFIYELIDRLN